jgi:RimJ/RimL family protein N-acetyltransferase
MKKTAKAKKPAKAKRSAKSKKSSPFYAQSKRLAYRLITPADEALYCELFTDAKALEHVGPALSPDRASASFKKALEYTAIKPVKQRISVIVERATKKPIGIASLKLTDADRRSAEGGILLKPTAHAQRFAIESSLALISVAFRHHTIDELTAQVSVEHKAGEKLVVGSGYSLHSQIAPEGDRAARNRWAMTRELWAATFK